MAEHLSDLLTWAKYVDQGIRMLEYSVERNGLEDNEVDQNEAMLKLQQITDDAKTLKMSAQQDVELLKVMSDEMKNLINITNSEEMMAIDQDLKTMLNMLFPNEVIVEDSLPVPAIDNDQTNESEQTNENEQTNVGGNLFVPPLAEASSLSPVSSQQFHPEESFAEVEITPGLMSKVPKSRVETGDLIPLSERFVDFIRPIRKKTLVFSPGEFPRPEQSSIPETSTPQSVLKDCTNFGSRARAYARNCELTSEDTIDSPEILQRPTKPILTIQLDGL